MNRMYLRAFFAAVLAALLMGSLCIFVRESGCGAQVCSFSRFSIGLLAIGAVGAFQAVRSRASLAFSGKAFVSGIGISLCILFYYLAITQTSAGIAALLPATGPLFAAVWESLLERHLPPRRDALLILTAGLGIVMVSCFAGQASAGHNDALGVVYGLLSGLSYSLYILLNRRMEENVTLLQRTFWQSLAGTLLLLVPLAGCEGAAEQAMGGWPWLLGIGVCQGVGVLALVAYAMKHLTSLEFGIVSCLEPTEAAALGWLVYAEAIMPGQWCGFVLVLSAIFAKSALSRKAEPDPAPPAENHI